MEMAELINHWFVAKRFWQELSVNLGLFFQYLSELAGKFVVRRRITGRECIVVNLLVAQEIVDVLQMLDKAHTGLCSAATEILGHLQIHWFRVGRNKRVFLSQLN
jgi:hypothetical protein